MSAKCNFMGYVGFRRKFSSQSFYSLKTDSWMNWILCWKLGIGEMNSELGSVHIASIYWKIIHPCPRCQNCMKLKRHRFMERQRGLGRWICYFSTASKNCKWQISWKRMNKQKLIEISRMRVYESGSKNWSVCLQGFDKPRTNLGFLVSRKAHLT